MIAWAGLVVALRPAGGSRSFDSAGPPSLAASSSISQANAFLTRAEVGS